LRVPGGLIDFKMCLEAWSPLRVHSGINRLEKVLKKMGRKPTSYRKLYQYGLAYEQKYPKYSQALNEFFDDMHILEWRSAWPYDKLEDGEFSTLLWKIYGKFGAQKSRKIRLTDQQKYLEAAKLFISKLLTYENANNEEIEWIVTHNALEPFDPAKNLDFFGKGAKAIVVDRDPRDIYITSTTNQKGFNDNLPLYQSLAGANNIETFILRYNLYRSQIVSSENVLRINFDDLIYQFDHTRKKLFQFLNIENKDWVYKNKFFDLESSKKNTRMWLRGDINYNKLAILEIEKKCLGI
jgi:hypothetical protein